MIDDSKMIPVLIIGLVVMAGLVCIMTLRFKGIEEKCDAHWRAQIDKCDCRCLQDPADPFMLNITMPAQLNLTEPDELEG